VRTDASIGFASASTAAYSPLSFSLSLSRPAANRGARSARDANAQRLATLARSSILARLGARIRSRSARYFRSIAYLRILLSPEYRYPPLRVRIASDVADLTGEWDGGGIDRITSRSRESTAGAHRVHSRPLSIARIATRARARARPRGTSSTITWNDDDDDDRLDC